MSCEYGGSPVQIGLVRTAAELEAAFALLMLVFVEEQHVPVEEELDAYDVTATHFMVQILTADRCCPGGTVATGRLVDKGSGMGKIGRVAVHADHRGRGIGAALMRHIHDHALEHGFRRMILEAQCYAIPFYEKLGYVADGEVFLDAGIEHRHMSLSLQSHSSVAHSSSSGVTVTGVTASEYP